MQMLSGGNIVLNQSVLDAAVFYHTGIMGPGTQHEHANNEHTRVEPRSDTTPKISLRRLYTGTYQNCRMI